MTIRNCLLAVLMTLAGCSSDNDDNREVDQQNALKSYQIFCHSKGFQYDTAEMVRCVQQLIDANGQV